MMFRRVRSRAAGRSAAWVVVAGAVGIAACGESGASGKDGVNGNDGKDGRSCTVADNGDGTMTVACPDGTTAIVAKGADGRSSLVTVTAASAAQCAGGGKIIQVGVDDGAGGGIAGDGPAPRRGFRPRAPSPSYRSASLTRVRFARTAPPRAGEWT